MEKVNYINLTLAEIVTDDFRKSDILHKYNLDFCCGGNKLLKDACAENNLSVEKVIDELENSDTTPHAASMNFKGWKLDFLIDYIVNTHHEYVRNSIPVLLQYTKKIAQVHGQNHSELIEIAKIFEVIAHDLMEHLEKEEKVLFPNMKKLIEAQNTGERNNLVPVSGLIQEIESEHIFVGDEIHKIVSLSMNYTVPSDGCNTYKITYQKLMEFENDIHQHIHLENNILHKRVIEIEKQLFL